MRKPPSSSKVIYKSEYSAWINMLHRCFNPDHPQYKDYGGRGIWVHPDWIFDWDAFFVAVGPKPEPTYTLERIENSRGYEPGNVCWATRREQQRNTRATRYVTYDGRTQSLLAWAEEIGIPVTTLANRLNRDWPLKDAMTLPARHYNRVMGTIVIDGVRDTVRGHTRRRGMSDTTVYARLQRGISLEEALSPVCGRSEKAITRCG